MRSNENLPRDDRRGVLVIKWENEFFLGILFYIRQKNILVLQIGNNLRFESYKNIKIKSKYK